MAAVAFYVVVFFFEIQRELVNTWPSAVCWPCAGTECNTVTVSGQKVGGRIADCWYGCVEWKQASILSHKEKKNSLFENTVHRSLECSFNQSPGCSLKLSLDRARNLVWKMLSRWFWFSTKSRTTVLCEPFGGECWYVFFFFFHHWVLASVPVLSLDAGGVHP